MDNKDVAKKWFNKANNDLITAEYLLTMQSPPTDTICFHSQQVAEKYHKGLLAFHGKETPKIHDLEELISICKEIDSKFTDFYDIASELSGYAVEVRYPLEEDYEITFEEAQLAFKNARKIKEFVLTRLKSKLS